MSGSRPKRRLGQHFLSDPRVLARIAEATRAGPGDTVLEIGPGPGGLTRALLETGARVVAIEKDSDVLPALRSRAAGAIVLEADALEADWHGAAGHPDPGRFIVAGNIPYNITSPLIERALTPPLPARIVFLVQKEVADRIAAGPGTRAYGGLSAGVQAAARVERLFGVPAGAFSPRPKVDSAVIRLTPLAEPLVAETEREAFRRAVTGLFGYRRKQLVRGVRELTGWTAERSLAVLEGAGVDPTARPETLSPANFAVLSRKLVDGGWNRR